MEEGHQPLEVLWRSEQVADLDKVPELSQQCPKDLASGTLLVDSHPVPEPVTEALDHQVVAQSIGR